MIITPHVAAGAAIGAVVTNPVLVLPLALASHYALDMLPHWQETLAPYLPSAKTYQRVAVDVVVAAIVTSIIIRWHPDAVPTILLGIVCATLPDIDSFLVFLPKLRRGIIQAHWNAHCAIQQETASLWGLVPQVLVVLVALVGARA